MYPPVDLRQVACFVAAASTGTMTAAGAELHLSQSAVSLAIKALERRLGEQLVVRRSARPLLLTPSGRRLFPVARQLLAQADTLTLAARVRPGTISGPLSVGCYRTIAPLLLPGLLQGFAARYPDVDVDFVEGPVDELEAAMRDGHCDLAVVDTARLSPDITYETLFRASPYALFAADDPLAERESVTVEELVDRDLILFDLPPSGTLLERVFSARGLRPRIRHRTSSHELVRALVGRGMGFALLLTRPVHDRTQEGLAVRAVRIAGEVPEHTFYLAQLAGTRFTAQAAAFAAYARAEIADGNAIGGGIPRLL